MLIIYVPFFHCYSSHFSGWQHYVRQGAVPQWETDFWISGCQHPSSELRLKTKISRKRSKSLTPRPRVRWRQDCWETSSDNSASIQQRMSCRYSKFVEILIRDGFFKGFDDPSWSKCNWRLEAAKLAGHHEQDRGWWKPRRADHGCFQVSNFKYHYLLLSQLFW